MPYTYKDLMKYLNFKGGRLSAKCIFLIIYVGKNYVNPYILIPKHGTCSNEANKMRIFIFEDGCEWGDVEGNYTIWQVPLYSNITMATLGVQPFSIFQLAATLCEKWRSVKLYCKYSIKVVANN
jgi:hypothetical protein